jgi:transcriptional regulator with XRE-family HTH domain
VTGDMHARRTFADRLDELFRTVVNSDGRLYSTRAAAAALAALGCPVSHTHVGKLRRGEADPRRSEMQAFATLFGVSLAYFTQDDGDETEVDRRLARALGDPAIQAVAMRMGEAEMSAAGKAAVAAMVEQVVLLEQAARQRHSPPDG